MNRRIATIATAIGCSGALILPLAPAMAPAAAMTATSTARDSRCAAVPSLQKSAVTARRQLGNHTSLTIWSDPIKSSTWWGARQLQLTLVEADLATSALDVRSDGFPGATRPLDLVDQSGAPAPTAMINGDFFDMFDTGDYSPHGPVVQDGKLLYAPYVKTLIAGQITTVVPPAEIQRVTGTVRLGSVPLNVRRINGRTVTQSSAVLYDRRWSVGPLLPRSATAVVIRRGLVYRIVPAVGIEVPRTAGTKVLLVPTALTSSLAQVRVGQPVKIQLTATDGSSDQPRTVLSMASTEGHLEGSLQVGDTTIPIGALNYHNVSGNGAAAFDANWVGRRLPKSGATVVYADGAITRVFRTGSRAPVPAGSTVIQLPNHLADLARTLHRGDSATLTLDLKTQSGAVFTEAFGHGSYILQSGVVRASCTDMAETDRPRTVLGWNESGQIFMLTATSGRPDEWGGFRIGGGTINEMATWIKLMGATHAVNLDGGGSTSLITKRSGVYQRVDLPKNTYLRPVPNAIAFVPR